MRPQQIKKTVLFSAVLLTTTACSWLQQPPAPVETGSIGGGTTTQQPVVTDPYGTGAGSTVVTPVAPPVTSGTYTPSYAPVDVNARTHTVVRGDTVYNLSKRYNVPQESIRAWNNMADNTLSLGQLVNVKSPTAEGVTSVTVTPTTPPTATTPPATTTPPVTAGAGSVLTIDGIQWARPTEGRLVTRFTNANKGIIIAGSTGQDVKAAADGKVVYSGSGLRGYGNLIIVQHNAVYITAYAHNQSLLAKEGALVKRGQTIAKMGSSDTDSPKLRFEVRQKGQPVDPLKFVKY
ncbi:MAG: peptidoglycan DD-metalloendopeptidase family protein [Neisseriaceae bacterium]|nr:peptidoglycan DD-metalloendopeptidase family protein [Neisseriaceae bacterium]MBP6861915.1 peptidoglycan DD-metalloendopeptidase family protein [Neisseriaceae bacterium]